MKLASVFDSTRDALEKKFGPGVSGGGVAVTAELSREARMNDQTIGKIDSTIVMIRPRYVSGLASHSAAEALRTLPGFFDGPGAGRGGAGRVIVLMRSAPEPSGAPARS